MRNLAEETMPNQLASLIGNYVINKYRKQARRSGVRAAANNMRKQGYPLALALIVLVGRA